MFDAHTSKRLQLLRFTMVIALASRVGSATIRDAREAEAFVSYLRNASDEVNFLAGHLYGQNDNGVVRNSCLTLTRAAPQPAVPAEATRTPAGPAQAGAVTPPPTSDRCDTFEALFESDIPQLEYKIVRLVLSALPQRQAGEFLRSARSGNVLGAAWQFLKLAAAAADGFHRGAAVYRSSQEILAIAIFTANGEGSCATNPTGGRIRTVEDAANCLGLSPDHLFDNPDEVRVRFPRDIGYEPFQALYEIVRTSCGLLPIEVGLNSDETIRKTRRDDCARLVFAPRLRFGGRTTWEAVGQAITPPPAPPAGNSSQDAPDANSNSVKPEGG